MNKNHECPQCGTHLIEGDFSHPGCYMCGWGKDADPNLFAPKNDLKTKVKLKSYRWKAGAMAAIMIFLVGLFPVIKLGSDQVLASVAIGKANKQMNKRLYASAARTLNSAPSSPPLSGTNKQMDKLLADNIRWARDISEVKVAKKAMVQDKPTEALDNLNDIEEDFPQESEATDLVDLAQDQTIDPDIDVTEDQVDEIAFTPDDPEADNIDSIASEAQDQQNITVGDAADTSAESKDLESSTVDQAIDAVPADTVDDIPDDVALDELPEAPDDTPEEAALPAAKKSSKLVPLYVMGWYNKVPPKHTTQDTFLTTDLNGEYKTQKDKKNGFGTYYQLGTMGNLYKRKVKGNKNVVPLYRYWSGARTDHYYTTNPHFASSGSNYVRQGAAGYIGKWDGSRCLAGTTPLYTVWNKGLTDNHYNTNAAFINGLVQAGWKNKNVVGCVW